LRRVAIQPRWSQQTKLDLRNPSPTVISFFLAQLQKMGWIATRRKKRAARKDVNSLFNFTPKDSEKKQII